MDLSAYGGETGDTTVVLTQDDFEVTRLRASIHYANGQGIEGGNALETPAKSGP